MQINLKISLFHRRHKTKPMRHVQAMVALQAMVAISTLDVSLRTTLPSQIPFSYSQERNKSLTKPRQIMQTYCFANGCEWRCSLNEVQNRRQSACSEHKVARSRVVFGDGGQRQQRLVAHIGHVRTTPKSPMKTRYTHEQETLT